MELTSHDTQPALALYFTDAAGARWRVYDVTFAGGKLSAQAFAGPGATGRLLVSAEGRTRRPRTFTKGEGRTLDPATVLRQLRGRGYLGAEHFDASTRDAK